MAGERSRNAELRQLWAEFETALWHGLDAVKRQDEIAGTELDELSTAHLKVLRTLNRMRELIDR